MADMTLYSGDYATLDFVELETSECSEASRLWLLRAQANKRGNC